MSWLPRFLSNADRQVVARVKIDKSPSGYSKRERKLIAGVEKREKVRKNRR